jgi:hypothetical protein
MLTPVQELLQKTAQCTGAAPLKQSAKGAKCLYYMEKTMHYQTLKLSPQPHSPLALGFWNLKASFRPCLTKSTTVPSISGRLAASTTGLLDADAQADAGAAFGQVIANPIRGRFGQQYRHIKRSSIQIR